MIGRRQLFGVAAGSLALVQGMKPEDAVAAIASKTGSSGAKAAGAPAILFTPAEPGQAYERCLRLVDTWIDDGDPAAGDFVVGPDYARLRLSAE